MEYKMTMKDTATISNMNYVFSGSTGNLTSRTGMLPQAESFAYDNSDRLTAVRQDNVTTMSMAYHANGNIASKSGLGSYSYYKPHAVSGVDNTGGLISENDQTITYTAFDKVSSISETAGPDSYLLNITYGPDRQRWKSTLKTNNAVTRTTVYADDYEIITEGGTTKHLYYLGGESEPAAIYVKQSGQADKVYYAHKDHLGSIVKLTDGAGAEVFRASYDAWGRRTLTNSAFRFHRGYTGHEHLDEFRLIDMNGRMYDPLLARFLSPDPFVQAPESSQNYNRYTYCLNNPLLYTDPTGEAFGIDDLFLAISMAYFSGLQTNFSYAGERGKNPFNPGNWNWGSSHTYISIAGAVGGHYSPFQVPGILTNGALQASIQVGINGIGNLTEGKKFFNNWYWSAGIGFMDGAISGYGLSKENGLNYWWGNEVKNGRNQWSFFNNELPKETVYYNIKHTSATANNTCVPQTLAELETSKGGTRSEADFRKSTGWTEEGVEIANSKLGNSSFLKNQGFNNSTVGKDFISDVSNMQLVSERRYNVVVVHDQSGMRHMTTINKINYYQSGKVKIYCRGTTFKINKLQKRNPYYFIIK